MWLSTHIVSTAALASHLRKAIEKVNTAQAGAAVVRWRSLTLR